MFDMFKDANRDKEEAVEASTLTPFQAQAYELIDNLRNNDLMDAHSTLKKIDTCNMQKLTQELNIISNTTGKGNWGLYSATVADADDGNSDKVRFTLNRAGRTSDTPIVSVVVPSCKKHEK